MDQTLIGSLVILGGGTAGWMTAAALARALNGRVAITLVESDSIGTVGVGEGTIPPITAFNRMLGIDEDDFLRATKGTFKSGIAFDGWGQADARYLHAFGNLPTDVTLASFEQVWQKMRQRSHPHGLHTYSITATAALAGKFAHPGGAHPLQDNLAYAYHFDAGLYARYLRRYSEARGVRRIEGNVVQVTRAGDSGDIATLVLEGARVVAADFFVDCSGFAGCLIEQVLHTGYDDWSHWLPCDRAVFVPSASTAPPVPYTRASVRGAGWQWAIPLQHRVGNGYVHASSHISEDEAVSTLLSHLGGAPLAEPRTLHFRTGMRSRAWHRNCVAIGLAGGFLEPLESTSIHLVQTAVMRLLRFFPTRVSSQVDITEYNRQSRAEYEQVRDFVILHYHAGTRRDTPFWQARRAAPIPDSLVRTLSLYCGQGRIVPGDGAIFQEGNWVQVLDGQGVHPAGYSPIVDAIDVADVEDYFAVTRAGIEALVAAMPAHVDCLRKYSLG